jgi:hypothetical protein
VQISGNTFYIQARDYERLPETLAGLHFVAFAILMVARFVQLVQFLNPPGCGCS